MTSDEHQELELLRALDIKRAQDSFLYFYMRMTGFTPEPHHRVTCKALQALEDDKIDRLMIFMPPRMGKSTLASMLFPAWIMGKYPNSYIMSVVHTQLFANKVGKTVRNYMRSDMYPFETKLATDSQAKDQFATTDGGAYAGFGLLGGSQHGSPAEWLISDDLIKGRKMAMSAHMREEAFDGYQSDMLTRLQGRQKQVFMTTRWSEDDVAGRILPEDFDGKTGWYKDRETEEKWYVLSLPAKAEHDNDPLKRKIGEYMWPDEFQKKFETVEMRGGYIWSALYQQRPSPEEGLLFQNEHIQYYKQGDIDLGSLTIYITSDYAVTAEAGASDPDYTVHTVWGIDPEFNIYMLDVWRGRTLSDEWVNQFLRLVKTWKPLMAGEEQGQIIKGVGPFLVRQMREESVFIHRKQYTSSTSKEQRAQSLLGMAAMGKFYLPRGHPMTETFKKELLSFPAGKHDDLVDTASLLAIMLGDIISGTSKRKKDSPHGESLYELFLRSEEEE